MHVRLSGNKLVYLEQLKPKFLRKDGTFEIGSDVSQVFSHMEVQTF